jgi:hypothetical protein
MAPPAGPLPRPAPPVVPQRAPLPQPVSTGGGRSWYQEPAVLGTILVLVVVVVLFVVLILLAAG